MATIAPESPTHSTVLVAESTSESLPATDTIIVLVGPAAGSHGDDHRGSRTERANPADPDEALRVAIKAAVDAGDTARAMALLEVLRSSPKPALVVDLAARRGR